MGLLETPAAPFAGEFQLQPRDEILGTEWTACVGAASKKLRRTGVFGGGMRWLARFRRGTLPKRHIQNADVVTFAGQVRVGARPGIVLGRSGERAGFCSNVTQCDPQPLSRTRAGEVTILAKVSAALASGDGGRGAP